MLRIDEIRLHPGEDESILPERAAARLHLPVGALNHFRIVRRSVDARKEVSLVYSVQLQVRGEEKVLRHCRDKHISKAVRTRYTPSTASYSGAYRPVIVGAGPAGLFCALALSRAGAQPILLERGAPVEQRREDVAFFWKTGLLSPASNVQFGEGGAGTFSDGKLNTGTHDARNRYILEQLVRFGAPKEILIDAKPHVGTDKLYFVLQNIRQELLSLGCDIRFGQRLSDLELKDGRVRGVHTVSCSDGFIDTDTLVLAIGHSARDTFELLARRGVPMEQKPFAVGVRIEHRQREIDMAQYGRYAGHPALPPTAYKLSCHTSGGRGVFSFCVCPGGTVVAAASEQGRVVTNGMSEYARDGENINGGFLVGVGPQDFDSGDPLSGVAFQRRLEAAAYRLGGGNFIAPAQRVEDFLSHRPSVGPGAVLPTYRPGVRWTDLHQCLPPFLSEALEEALPMLGKRVTGYDAPDAVLTAVESRSSSPVRILRDADSYQSPIAGLYPCDEGAGYAGGILSAAADGLRCAEKILTCGQEGSDV